jgi:DNA-directed RNA polymerase specialized sigma24 family protein
MVGSRCVGIWWAHMTATKALNGFIQRLRRGVRLLDEARLTDGELLAAYVVRRDQAAFATLVQRHGPMVLGVCRRILRNDADAEDAFQATFLVLIRKASTIRTKALVSNWLYGVAQNTALQAKALNRRRQTKEREAGPSRKCMPPRKSGSRRKPCSMKQLADLQTGIALPSSSVILKE